MEQLKTKVKKLEKLCEKIQAGLSKAHALDDEDIFEAEFQLDSSLKGLKVVKFMVENVENMASDLLVSDGVCGAEHSSTNTPLVKTDVSDSEIEYGGSNQDIKLQPVEAGTHNNEGAVKIMKESDVQPMNEQDEEYDEDVLAEFLNDDDDDDFLEDLDTSDVITNEEDCNQDVYISSDDESDDIENTDDSNVEPPTPKHRQTLKQHFGYKSFRPFQWSVISGVLNERIDQCVIMATGYGKSLCYQYASVYTGRTTVVISPLISLMTDQVASLRLVNIPATYLGSAQENSAEVRRDLTAGKYRIVYVTPELITGDSGGGMLQKLNANVGIDLIAVDEAHCVSHWGHDFRGAYQKLDCLKRMLPGVPILAVTATATPAVRGDICRSLGLVNPKMICTSFDRNNLRFSVQPKVEIYTDLRSQMTLDEDGKLCFDGPTIIYCPTKKSTDEVSQVVSSMGIRCGRYHAGLPLPQRKKAHEDFVADRIQAIVATVAFGMGIDKPDVRLIIHYGAPKDLESYYQETGRAGRDGGPSACVAFYAQRDFLINRMILSDIKNPKFLEHKTEMLQKMQTYLSSTHCRRKMILKHFDSKAKSPMFGTEDCCDNCANKLHREQNNNISTLDSKDDGKMRFGELFDFGKEAKLLLEAVHIFKQKFGLGAAVALVSGSSDKRAQWFNNSSVYGAGKHRTQKWWMTFGRLLLSAGYLAEERVPNGFGSTVCFTSQGQRWLDRTGGNPVLKLEPNHELLALEKGVKTALVNATSTDTKILPAVACNSWLSTKQLTQFVATVKQIVDGPEEKERQARLYSELMKLRNTLAEEQGVAPYMVASNKNLLDLAKFRPTDLDNLAKIEDLAQVKQQKFGQRFIECVSKFCSDATAEGNRFPEETAPILVKEPEKPEIDQETLMQIPETARISYSMLERQGMSVERVCRERGIKPATVAGHMACAIKYGIPVDIENFGVTDKIQKLIIDTIRAPPINSDISKRTPIKEALPDYVTWEQLQIVIAILERQFGITGVGSTVKSTHLPMSVANSQPSSQDSQTGKRKLPPWMATSSKAVPAVKKQKSNLFKR